MSASSSNLNCNVYRLTQKIFLQFENIQKENFVEVCGFVQKDLTESSVIEDSINIGSVEQQSGRHMCTYNDAYKTNCTIHTHPIISYAYPSFEDINNVLKKNRRNFSLVFTSWGMWLIQSTTNRIPSSLKDKYEENIHALLDYIGLKTSIERSSRPLFNHPITGEKLGVIKSKPLSQEIQNTITRQLEKFNTKHSKYLKIDFFSYTYLETVQDSIDLIE